MKHPEQYDIIVVGGGHAGIEAALAGARMGCSVALLTMDPAAIGRMSCNPAIGGTAKGHLVREIDALGGEMGSLADATGIHFRMLNRSKGPAVWSPRCQNDREWYGREARSRVESQPGIFVLKETLADILVEDARVVAGVTASGKVVGCGALVMCSGTFLDAVMHTGEHRTPGGRIGEPASVGLTERFQRLGFVMGRLKTGTPPRLDLRTLDLSETEEQAPDPSPVPFSHRTVRITNPQVPMYLTYTNPATHDVLRTGFDRSPMFTGRIRGVGPRYCPSIEDKIQRFADRPRHQIFLEPEGYDSTVVYVNGFSTSLPEDVQQSAVRTVPGLRRARMIRPGYAVEYGFFPPFQVEHTLETKRVKGLFFAGQINGTSGYEEAAAQGLIAGINAANRVRGGEPFVLSRSEAYIGVMIDDLINKSTEEPYRIFTSRAEYRLSLRQDNADSRLMRKGHAIGLVASSHVDRVLEKERRVAEAIALLREVRVPGRDAAGLSGVSVREPTTLFQLLKRPEVRIDALLELSAASTDERLIVLRGDRDARERVEIEVKYDGYLKRQDEEIRLFESHEGIHIPHGFDFGSLRAMSNEGVERLARIRPRSFGQASRISGVTVADLSVLLVHLRR